MDLRTRNVLAIGFLRNGNRINVSSSRQMEGLFIIADVGGIKRIDKKDRVHNRAQGFRHEIVQMGLRSVLLERTLSNPAARIEKDLWYNDMVSTSWMLITQPREGAGYGYERTLDIGLALDHRNQASTAFLS